MVAHHLGLLQLGVAFHISAISPYISSISRPYLGLLQLGVALRGEHALTLHLAAHLVTVRVRVGVRVGFRVRLRRRVRVGLRVGVRVRVGVGVRRALTCVPMMVTTSASMWPLERASRPARWARPGARMWHRYGRLEPSDTM